MRILKTFVLRLLIDSETPTTLRGAIRAIANDEEYTFTDGQTLLALLQQIGQAALRKEAHPGPQEAAPDGAAACPPEWEGEGGEDRD